MWADARFHPRTMRRKPDLRKGDRWCWQCKRMGAQNRATHFGCCNGAAMTEGCEWHVRRWVKGLRDGRLHGPKEG